ncbi:MAG: metal-dependent transcriptional regulator [Methanocellales archaeon]|nr:metal-dependent transcriptional regulator [Methanocellales archaeon]
MSEERFEEYLEALYTLTEGGKPAKTTEIASFLGVAPASVTEMLQKLADMGYVNYQPYYGALLTKKGLDVALKVKRRHRLLERFLVDFLGMREGNAHKEACKLEHVVSDDMERRFCSLMGHPKKCPDGNPIARASCCIKKERFP